jgi:hypothetical protein
VQGPAAAVNEYNFEAGSGFVSVNTGGGVVATVSTPPGTYNVTATALTSSAGMSCRLQTQSSSGHGSFFQRTVSAHTSDNATLLVTGAVRVDSGSVIEEFCTGSKSGTKVLDRNLTAVQVASAGVSDAASVGHGPARAVGGPRNRFVAKSRRR